MLLSAVDPGKGGFFVFEDNPFKAIPLNQSFIDLHSKIMGVGVNKKKICLVEKAAAYKNQGTKSIYSYLVPYGGLLAILEICGFEIYYVTPREWQKYYELTKPEGKTRHERRKNLKLKSCELASKVWGQKINNHNLADALLILNYLKNNLTELTK